MDAETPDAEGDGTSGGSQPGGMSTRTVVTLTFAMELPLFGIGYVWMRAQGLDPLAELRPSSEGMLLGGALGVGISALSLGSLALARRVPALRGWQTFVEGTLGGALGSAGLPALALLSVCAGLSEETFFRGALQGAVGVVPAAAVFGVAHVGVPSRQTLPFLAYTTLVGLAFGYARLSQPLFPLAVAHAVVDLIDTTYLHATRAGRATT